MKKEFLFGNRDNLKGDAERKNVLPETMLTSDGNEKDKSSIPAKDVTIKHSFGIGIKEYEETFLFQPQPASRKQTYIGCGVYSKLNNILPVIGNGISIPTFLNNVLEHHLSVYKAEMKELFHDRVQNIQKLESFTLNREKMENADNLGRSSGKEYESHFLIRLKTVQRRQTYINCDLYDKLNRFLVVLDSDVSVPIFLNNMLEHHLRAYKNVIEELFHDKIEKMEF